MTLLIALLLAAPLDCKTTPALAKKAKITCANASKTALGKVPGATVKEAELEEEHGKLVWSFDLATKGKSGIDEVQVDALTGEVSAVEHEDAKSEAAEKAAEKAGKK